MALLTVQKVTKSSAGLSLVATAAGGDTFPNADGVFIQADKSTVGDATLTIAAVTDPIITPEAGSLVVPDIVITVPAEGNILFSVPPSHTAVGIVTMTYSSETDLTIAAAVVAQ